MSNSIKRSGLFLLVLICLGTYASGQTVFDIGISTNHHVHEFRVGGRHEHRQQPLFAGNGFHYSRSYTSIYLVNTFPGSYSLNFAYPAHDININPVVSLFDRWPYDPFARRYELPMGPKALNNRKHFEYRWNMSISPSSTSSLLYIAVEVPAGLNSSIYFPHDITIMPQALSPMHTLEKGITYLQGPANMVLASEGQAELSYAVDKAEQGFDTGTLPAMPIKNDLIKNWSFNDGLRYWTPHRDRISADDVKTFSLSDGILKIRATIENAREGIMQEVNADVSGAYSVVLMADVMVKEQTQAGLGPKGVDAPVAIAVGYKDSAGGDNKALVFYKGFYSLKSEDTDNISDGQLVLKDQWYRNIFDLMQLEPKPVSIQYISLEGSGWPAREGWIRDIHLIKSGGKE
ncbi:MAG: hypothetical protein JW927_13860 [Deltaproteobacteria bacterium]|nr:hypothetical protein [Deltaproteobacteria bacterium]